MGIADIAVPDQLAVPMDELAWLEDVVKNLVGALITTIDETGIMHTRQVPNVNREFNGDLWFMSSFGSSLVAEVQVHPDVLVTYADRGARRFVVVNGIAQVRRDPDRARALWQPNLGLWLPEGPDDPALAMIQVKVESVDLWE